MTKLYIPLFILQAYCLHHAYENRVNSIWYFLILFVPLLGSLVYLYKFIYTSHKVEVIVDEAKELIDTNYKEKKMTHKLNHADTIQNKMVLAKEYANKGEYTLAISLYESCLESISNDTDLYQNLVLLHFYNKDYNAAIKYGVLIKDDPFFKNNEERIALAWSYYEIGDLNKAEETFNDMNRIFSNYIHRIEFVKFYKLIHKTPEAISLLETMKAEFDRMEKSSKRLKKDVYRTLMEVYHDVKG